MNRYLLFGWPTFVYEGGGGLVEILVDFLSIDSAMPLNFHKTLLHLLSNKLNNKFK